MEYFKEIVKLVPSNWEEANYTGNRFVLKNVDASSQEFQSVTNDLKDYLLNKRMVSVQRIQHPFAYGRFMLHKEQMQKKCLQINEKREAVSVQASLSEVETFIDFNCDNRRKVFSFENKYIIVKQVLVDVPERDTNWYPEYLIQYE